MQIKPQREKFLKKNRELALQMYKKFAIDYNNGMSASEIAKKYISPFTGKHYTRTWVQQVIQQIRVGKIII